MSPCVPVTCPLPFDGKMWRNSKKVLKMISFMRSGYIRKVEHDDAVVVISTNAPIKMKTEIVDLLYGKSLESNVFKSMFSITDADEALKDFVFSTENDEMDATVDWEALPYLTTREHYNDSHRKLFKYMSIIN